MKHLHRVTSDIPKLRKMDFKCHCCVKAKMNHAPKSPKSITVISVPDQVVSMDIVGPFQVKSIQRSSYGLAFIEHCTNMQFLYRLKNNSDSPRYLRRFLLELGVQFKECVALQIHVLRSDNAQEFKSAEVLKKKDSRGRKDSLSIF